MTEGTQPTINIRELDVCIDQFPLQAIIDTERSHLYHGKDWVPSLFNVTHPVRAACAPTTS